MMFRPEAVFLDRDGTVIEDVHYINSPSRVVLLPGAAAAIRHLNTEKIPAIVVTNQSGIGRGLVTLEQYEAVTQRFHSLLAAEGAHVDATYYCPEVPDDKGELGCRKPGTQMFERGLRDFHLDAARVAYIGDRWRDVAASRKLGGRAIMISSPMTTDEDRSEARQHHIETAPTLADAVNLLCGLTELSRRP
jgi:D-glycero-D-manno-heptose 1,7-bisphosphate phosphatase